MTYLLVALMILSFGALHAQIGGMDSVGLAMPAYAALALAAGASLFFRNLPRTRPSSICIASSAAFFGYILIRAFFSPVPYLARQDIFMVVAALVVYLLTALFIVTPRMRLIFGGALLVLLAANVAVGLIQFKVQSNFMMFNFGRADYGVRASGLFTVPNQLPGFLNVVGLLGISAALWGRLRITLKLLVGYLSVVGFAAVILSGSRGGYLAGIAGLVVFALLSIYPLWTAYPHRFWKIAGLTAIAIGLISVMTGLAIQKSTYLSQRSRQIYEPRNMRVHLWESARQQFQQNPVFGTGSGTFRIYGRKFRDPSVQTDPIHVHNDYLELLGDYGALGILGFLCFLSVHVEIGLRSYIDTVRRRLSPHPTSNSLALQIGALCAISVYVVHSVFDFNLHIPANTLLMAFIFGIVANPGIRLSARAVNRRSPRGLRSASLGPEVTGDFGALAVLHDEIFGEGDSWGGTQIQDICEANEVTTRPTIAPVPVPRWARIALPALGLIVLCFGVRLWPGEHYAFLARMEDDKRERESTIRYASQAVRWDSKNPFSFYYLGQAYSGLGYRNRKSASGGREYYEKAVAAYDSAHRLFPDDVPTLANMAWSLDQMEDYDKAEEVWQSVLKLDPNFADYLAYYGEHLGEMDHYYRARDYFQKSLDLKHNETAKIGLEEMNGVIAILESGPRSPKPDTAAAY